MKNISFVFIFFALLLSACERAKPISAANEEPQTNIATEPAIAPEVIEQQPSETKIKREIKSSEDIAYYPIEPARDIFTGLFDDISDANHDEWGEGFTVTYKKPDEPFVPKEQYIVENDTIVVYFYTTEEIYLTDKAKEKMEAQGRRTNGFIAVTVAIKKNTNEYRLGNYMGRNINDVLNDCDNQYRVSPTYHDNVENFFFSLRYNENDSMAMGITFTVSDSIITEILYYYAYMR